MSTEPPQKILFVIDHFRNPYAGTERQLYRLLTGLDRSKFEPELLVFTESAFLKDQSVPCHWSSLGSSSLSSPITWIRLARFAADFRRRGGRLAHVFFNDPSILCPPVFSAFGIRTLISRRDMGYWYTPAIERVLRLTRFFVAGVVVNSRAVAEITHLKESIPKDRIHLIYNGVIEPDTRPEKYRIPAELIPLKERGAIIAILVANIRPIKRIEDAVAAIGHNRDQVPKLNLVVVGTGESSDLEERAQELGVSDRVHFLGGRSNVSAYLSAADIGLLCSESEGFSNSVVEYMQHGLPVICTQTGGNPEAIEDKVSGLLYPVADQSTLAYHLRELASSGTLRRQLGTRAKEEAYKRFSVRTMLEAHQSLYQSQLA